LKTSELSLRKAVEILNAGGIIAYPTEAVWGLGCDPLNEEALADLIQLKDRSWKKGLVLVAAHVDQLEPYIAPMSAAMRKRVTATWPGPSTWVLPASAGLSPLLTGGRSTIAVRVSAHPLVSALCQMFDDALVSTSANHSGHRPARSALQVQSWFGASIDFVLAGSTGSEPGPTEIRDAQTGKVLRPIQRVGGE